LLRGLGMGEGRRKAVKGTKVGALRDKRVEAIQNLWRKNAGCDLGQRGRKTKKRGFMAKKQDDIFDSSRWGAQACKKRRGSLGGDNK